MSTLKIPSHQTAPDQNPRCPDAYVELADASGMVAVSLPYTELSYVREAIDHLQRPAIAFKGSGEEFAEVLDLLAAKGLLVLSSMQTRLAEQMVERRLWIKDQDALADCFYRVCEQGLANDDSAVPHALLSGVARWFLMQSCSGSEELQKASRWIHLLERYWDEGLAESCLAALDYRAKEKGNLSGYDHIVSILERRMQDDRFGSDARRAVEKHLKQRVNNDVVAIPEARPGVDLMLGIVKRPLFAATALGALFSPCIGVDPISGALIGAYCGAKLEVSKRMLPSRTTGKGGAASFDGRARFACRELTRRLQSLVNEQAS